MADATKPATPAEAEELAAVAVGNYLTSCRMDSTVDLGNYLMKLVSVAGIVMAKTEGRDIAVVRLEGVAAFVEATLPLQAEPLSPVQ